MLVNDAIPWPKTGAVTDVCLMLKTIGPSNQTSFSLIRTSFSMRVETTTADWVERCEGVRYGLKAWFNQVFVWICAILAVVRAPVRGRHGEGNEEKTPLL